MNTLTAEMKRSLKELDLGLKGELTITSDMEDLSNSLFFDQVFLSFYLFFKHLKELIKYLRNVKAFSFQKSNSGFTNILNQIKKAKITKNIKNSWNSFIYKQVEGQKEDFTCVHFSENFKGIEFHFLSKLHKIKNSML